MIICHQIIQEKGTKVVTIKKFVLCWQTLFDGHPDCFKNPRRLVKYSFLLSLRTTWYHFLRWSVYEVLPWLSNPLVGPGWIVGGDCLEEAVALTGASLPSACLALAFLLFDKVCFTTPHQSCWTLILWVSVRYLYSCTANLALSCIFESLEHI